MVRLVCKYVNWENFSIVLNFVCVMLVRFLDEDTPRRHAVTSVITVMNSRGRGKIVFDDFGKATLACVMRAYGFELISDACTCVLWHQTYDWIFKTGHASEAAAWTLDVDLEYTALGLVFAKADVVCEYVTILAKTTEEAEVKNSQTHGAAWMRYGRVTPIFGSQTPFAVEGVTPISRVLQFEMSDGEPRLLVGTPTKSGTQITLLAERIFRVKTSDVEIYEKEMQAVHQTLQGDKIQPVASKRPAEAMIEETPSKKFAPAFLDQ